MAGKNITIAGATFNGVPSIDVPVSGGGTASYVEISDTTAQAADVAQGKYFYDAAGVKTEGTASGGGVDVEALSVTQNGTYTAPSGKAYSPVTVNVSGGGGASNIVTGTFKGTTAGTALDVTLNYSGTGYPIAVIVYPKGGITENSDFKNLIQRYVYGLYCIIKREQSLAPKYSALSPNDVVDVLYAYKSSTSSATTYSSGMNSATPNPYNNVDASTSNMKRVQIRSATKMSVLIASTSSYGFAANIEYTYYVIYSE